MNTAQLLKRLFPSRRGLIYLISMWQRCFFLMLLAALNGLAADRTYDVRLDTGWEYLQGTLGSIWEIWRGGKASDNVTWSPVTLPHCFNARDAVDPDVHY